MTNQPSQPTDPRKGIDTGYDPATSPYSVDPYLLLTTPGIEAKDLVISWANLALFRSSALKITRDAEYEAEHGEECRKCGSPGYDAEEHTYLKREVPALITAVEMLMTVAAAAIVLQTPQGLYVEAVSNSQTGEGGYVVRDPARDRFLRGAAQYETPAIEWVTPPPGRPCQAYTASERKVYTDFMEAVIFRGGFWQAWATALRAEVETLPLPLEEGNDGAATAQEGDAIL